MGGERLELSRRESADPKSALSTSFSNRPVFENGDTKSHSLDDTSDHLGLSRHLAVENDVWAMSI